jgi:hypothetical protein
LTGLYTAVSRKDLDRVVGRVPVGIGGWTGAVFSLNLFSIEREHE